MGRVAAGSVAAKVRAAQRLAVLHADRAERDARIAAAAAAVFEAQAAVRVHAERRAAAVAAAERAIADALAAERDANTAAGERIVAAVGRLRADGLRVGELAELLEVPPAEVRRWTRPPAAGPGRAGGAGE